MSVEESPPPTQDIDEIKTPTQSSIEIQLEKSYAATESNAVPIKTPRPQEEPSDIPVESKPPLDSNEKSSQPEIEIPKEIPKSEPNIPSSVSNEETPVKEENNSDKRVENNNPPEVINEQSPAVIKSTKNESQDNSENNSSQSMTSSQQGM